MRIVKRLCLQIDRKLKMRLEPLGHQNWYFRFLMHWKRMCLQWLWNLQQFGTCKLALEKCFPIFVSSLASERKIQIYFSDSFCDIPGTTKFQTCYMFNLKSFHLRFWTECKLLYSSKRRKLRKNSIQTVGTTNNNFLQTWTVSRFN